MLCCFWVDVVLPFNVVVMLVLRLRCVKCGLILWLWLCFACVFFVMLVSRHCGNLVLICVYALLSGDVFCFALMCFLFLASLWCVCVCSCVTLLASCGCGALALRCCGVVCVALLWFFLFRSAVVALCCLGIGFVVRLC